MQCEYRPAREEEVPALRELWKEAFGDGDQFLDQFFCGPFAPERSRVAVVDEAVAGALYWFPGGWPISMAWQRRPGSGARDCAAA